jgi:hypothetical protein
MNWKPEYTALKDYIANHAEIIINQSEISIPQSLRDEFYQLFDDLRRAVVGAYASSLAIDFELLSRNYCEIEREILELLKLDSITMPMDLLTFLHSPEDGLMRILYNRTFDLLQGKISVENYEEQSEAELKSVAADLFRLGYEHWAGLVMIKLLEPDEAFFVDLDEDYKPYLAELTSIAFGRQAHHPTLRIPEFVVHSRKLNKYVAAKMVLAREIESLFPAFKPAVRPKKKTGDTSFALDSRVMLLSFMQGKEDIPIIADIYELIRTSPDWAMEYILESELTDPAALEQVNRNLRLLSPRLGMCLAIVGGGEEARPESMPENVRTVSAGFDQSRLASIINTFVV